MVCRICHSDGHIIVAINVLALFSVLIATIIYAVIVLKPTDIL
jgi:hypothetical protein